MNTLKLASQHLIQIIYQEINFQTNVVKRNMMAQITKLIYDVRIIYFHIKRGW